jgi:hypothetical protein
MDLEQTQTGINSPRGGPARHGGPLGGSRGWGGRVAGSPRAVRGGRGSRTRRLAAGAGRLIALVEGFEVVRSGVLPLCVTDWRIVSVRTCVRLGFHV